MDSPDTFTLCRVPWQLFGSLTFRSVRGRAVEDGISRFFAMGRKFCEAYRGEFARLLWVLRPAEKGEISGRVHQHFLMGGVPQSQISVLRCGWLMGYWEAKGGGMARVRVYDRRLNGPEYVSKCLDGQAGADRYELGKFDGASHSLMVAKSVERYLQAETRRSALGLALVSTGNDEAASRSTLGPDFSGAVTPGGVERAF